MVERNESGIPDVIQINLQELNTPYKLAHSIKNSLIYNSVYWQYCIRNPSILDSKGIIPPINNSNIDDEIKNNDTNIIGKKTRKTLRNVKHNNTDMYGLPKNKIKINTKQLSPIKTVKLIAKALFRGKWNGLMLYDNDTFSMDTYHSILECNNINLQSQTVKFIWNIIYASQKKINDSNISENTTHIKWFWFDNNTWKYRKYHIIVCKWLTKTSKAFIKRNKKYIKMGNSTIKERYDFAEISNNYDFNNNDEFKNNSSKKPGFKDELFLDFKRGDLKHELLIKKDKFIRKICFYHIISMKQNNKNIFFREIRNEHGLYQSKAKSNLIKKEFIKKPSPFIAPAILSV